MNLQQKQNMKKILKTFGLTVLVAGVIFAADRVVSHPAMHIKVRVVDEDGKPVAGVPAQVRFPLLGKAEQQIKTDGDGRAEFTFGSWPAPHIDVLIGNGCAPVRVAGNSYYAFRGIGYVLKSNPDPAMYRWEPWGPEVRLILKRVRRPVPLECIVRHMLKFKAGIGAEMAYDFLAKEWMPPYGQGKVTDAYIRVDTLDGKIPEKGYEYSRMNNLRVTVRFPNEGEGMIKFPHFMGTPVTIPYRNAGSVLWHDHEAPETGYAKTVAFGSLNDEEISKGVACTQADPSRYGFTAYEDRDAFGRLLAFATWQEAAYLKIRSGDKAGALYAVFNYGITANWIYYVTKESVGVSGFNHVPVIHMRYKLNPVRGDRNLEWNGVNLLSPTNDGEAWPKNEP